MKRIFLFSFLFIYILSAPLNILNDSIGHGQIFVTEKCSLFYILYGARDKNPRKEIPLTIYFNGGPGFSSMFNVIGGVGPFRLDQDENLIFNNDSLNLISDLLFIEQPIGTNGLSPCSEINDLPTSEDIMVEHLYRFFPQFYALYPQYLNISTYIVAESFAGHLVPKFLQKVYSSEYKQLKIISIMFLAPFVSPKVQFASFSRYAAWKFRPKMSDYMNVLGNDLSSFVMLKAKRYRAAYDFFVKSYKKLNDGKMRDFTMYNINEKCEGEFTCSNLDYVDKYFNKPQVQSRLGIDTTFSVRTLDMRYRILPTFYRYNSEIYDELLSKYNISISILIGQNDFIINILGELSWIKDLKYYKENDGKNSRYMNYQKSMTPYYKKSIGSKLSIYKIDDCGHLMG